MSFPPPWWANLLITVALLMAAAESGYWLAHRLPPRVAEIKKGAVTTMIAALLGLLGLLLGFSFSMVDERFIARKQLVVRDANALGTAYLRAGLLPAPHDQRVQALLRAYVELRLGLAPQNLDESMARTQALQQALWVEAEAVAAEQPRAHVTALFVNALNEVIDVHSERVTVALHQRLPRPVWFVLYGAALLALGVVGYGAGLSRERATFATLSVVMAIAIVTSLIAEIDSPTSAMVRVEQWPMVETQAMMQRH